MISERLQATLRLQLKLGEFDFQEATVASQVPGWDSLSHLGIIAAVEKEFGVRFRSLEVLRLKNVGDLQSLLDRKLAAG